MQKRRRISRRHSTIRRRKTKQSIWPKLLALCAVAAYTALAALLGVFLADNVLLPLNIGETSTFASAPPTLLPYQSPPPPTVTPYKTATPSEPAQTPKVEVVKDVTFPRLDYHAVQIGAFSSVETAETEAAEIKQRGGAGYILFDVRYRVFASVYLNESDARSVRDRLMSENGIDSYIYSGAVPAVELTVTASQEKINSISAGYEAWRTSLELMRKLSDLVDKGNMEPSEAINELFNSIEALNLTRDALLPGAGVEDESGVLEGLATLLQNMSARSEDFCGRNFADSIAFSAAIKYNYVEAVFEYKEYISAISSGFV